jgi:hypothetical protein
VARPRQQATTGSSTGPRGDALVAGGLGNQAGTGARRRRPWRSSGSGNNALRAAGELRPLNRRSCLWEGVTTSVHGGHKSQGMSGGGSGDIRVRGCQWQKVARLFGGWGNAAWHRPTCPRASRTGTHGAMHRPRDTDLSQRACTVRYGAGRHGAPTMSRAGVFQGESKHFKVALYGRILLENSQLKCTKV